MAKSTYLFLFAYIVFVLCSFALAQGGKKPPKGLETINIKATTVGKLVDSKTGKICVSYKSVLLSKNDTLVELFPQIVPPIFPPRPPLGTLKFPNNGKIVKGCFPKQRPGKYVIKYTFDATLATVMIKEIRKGKGKGK